MTDPPDDQDTYSSGQPLTDVQCTCGTWTAVTLAEAETSARILCDVCHADWWRLTIGTGRRSDDDS